MGDRSSRPRGALSNRRAFAAVDCVDSQEVVARRSSMDSHRASGPPLTGSCAFCLPSMADRESQLAHAPPAALRPRSATDQSHEMLRIPFPLHGDLRGGAFDLAKVVRRELDVGCSDVLLEALEL